MKKVWVFVLTALCCCLSVSQSATGSRAGTAAVNVSVGVNKSRSSRDIILYRNGLLLKRDDFRGAPEHGTLAVAVTGSTLGMDYTAMRTRDGRVHLEVSVLAGFDPKQSWFRETVRNVPRVLDHEQLHFDITALMAVRLRNAIAARSFGASSFQQELKAMLRDCQQDWQAMEERYDEETNHGIDTDAQARWCEHVRTSLVTEGGV